MGIIKVKHKRTYSVNHRGAKEYFERLNSYKEFERKVIAPRLKWRKMTEEERKKYE